MPNEIPLKFYNLEKAGVSHHPRPANVGELKQLLEELPDSLPISDGLGCSIEMVVYNAGDRTQALEFEGVYN